MIEWFASHTFLEQVFLLSGTVGGIVLLFRMILMIAGLDHPVDVHADGDAGAQALTVQGISSFLTLFGVVGYCVFHGGLLGGALAIVTGLVSGAFAMWLLHKIFRGMLRLQSSGTVNLFAAIGSEGTVYLTVGREGGRVQIDFANRLREFEAVSADGAAIPTGTPIRVQGVEANTLVVAPVDR
ncbi:MAG TPA: NfeD family protein [Steroidobacteraceae bacterium]|nr:NfeD family protein [Steroidobacteraceae bacterium]